MSHFDRIGGPDGIKAIVGSGFFWAWFDALFMSALFIPGESPAILPEYGAIAAFALSLPVFALVLWRDDLLHTLVGAKRTGIFTAAVGTAGSLLYLFSSLTGSVAMFATGALLCGIFMGVYDMAWSMTYCKHGARSALPLVAGAFALAPLLDAPLLFMIPEAKAAFFTLFPLASGLMYALLNRKPKPQGKGAGACDQPEHGQRDKTAFRPLAATMEAGERLDDSLARALGLETSPASSRGIMSFLQNHLGVSLTLIGAVALVMGGFGYLQHLISFSSVAGGISVQVARGAAAIIMFCLFMTHPKRSSTVFRVGFLVMIAGIMMMPFSFGSDVSLAAGAAIVGGYTAFDIFIWVAFSHIAHTRSKSPAKTVAFIRLVTNATTAFGLICGIALIGLHDTFDMLAFQETTVVGYLVVIATVMILSSEESAALLSIARPSTASSSAVGIVGENPTERLSAWFDSLGFTAREKDVAELLLQGRTQPWIAEALGISENTVGTHVRHIYQKAEVHDRQQLLDLAILSMSPEAREPHNGITGAD